jgi:hypothetical protein
VTADICPTRITDATRQQVDATCLMACGGIESAYSPSPLNLWDSGETAQSTSTAIPDREISGKLPGLVMDWDFDD